MFRKISISTVKHISVECLYGDEIHRNPSKAKQKRIQYKSSRENVSDRGNAKVKNCKEFPKWRKKNPTSASAIQDMYCNSGDPGEKMINLKLFQQSLASFPGCPRVMRINTSS